MDRVYLDLCCLKRPFDDQRSERIRREASAVARIIDRAERGLLELVRSPALTHENERNPREDRRFCAAQWIGVASVAVDFAEPVGARAMDLRSLGFSVMDALHVAFAEAAGARWLASCDDRLIDLGRRFRSELRIDIVNPCEIPPTSEVS